MEETSENDTRNKPPIPEKRFRLIENEIVWLDPDEKNEDSSSISDMEISNNIDKDSEDDAAKNLSKINGIFNECIEFIRGVAQSLSYLSAFKTEIMTDFQNNSEMSKQFSGVFKEVESLQLLYKMILEKIETMNRENSGSFPLLELFLDPGIAASLRIYKPFLIQYANNAKWVGELDRSNNLFQLSCQRAKEKNGIDEKISVDSCLYTIFYSLFSFQLFLSRYSASVKDEQHAEAEKAMNCIKDLLSVVDEIMGQERFLLTQQELNLLSGRSKEPQISTKYICKGFVLKMSRKDYKPLQRQLVLFSDCLFVTLLPSNITGISTVRSELSLDKMKLLDITLEENLKNPHCRFGFTISAREAKQDFFFENEQQMDSWKKHINHAVEELEKQKNAYGNVESDCCSKTYSVDWIGKESPKFQKDSDTNYCNGHRCRQKFVGVKKYHCRSDGLLYCDSCCNSRLKLPFERSPDSRVCELCYRILFKNINEPQLLQEALFSLDQVFQKKTHEGIPNGWLKVRKFQAGKGLGSEEKRFCELDQQDPVIHVYEKHEDKKCLDRIMLVGMEICKGTQCQFHQNLDSLQFCLKHIDKKEAFVFKTKSKEIRDQWMQSLKKSLDDWLDKDV